MTSLTDGEETAELLAAFALDALDGDEQAAVEAHLEHCESCLVRLDELREVSGHLAVAVVPPSVVWDRIRADITTSSGSPSRPERLGGRPRWVLCAAAAVVLVVGIATGRMSAGDPEPRVEDVAAAAADASGSRTVALSTPGGDVAVRVVLAASGEAYVLADGLVPLPTGRAYQLWAMSGEAMVSLGVLGNNPEVVAVGAPGRFDTLAITVEPAGGSPGPTSEPIAATA